MRLRRRRASPRRLASSHCTSTMACSAAGRRAGCAHCDGALPALGAHAAFRVAFACACGCEDRPARGDSVEAWAREARYAALGAMAREHAASSLVLLAHHRRRSGARPSCCRRCAAAVPPALAAMPRTRPARRRRSWARPWLDAAAQAIEAYVRRHRLRCIDDDSNDDDPLRAQPPARTRGRRWTSRVSRRRRRARARGRARRRSAAGCRRRRRERPRGDCRRRARSAALAAAVGAAPAAGACWRWLRSERVEAPPREPGRAPDGARRARRSTALADRRRRAAQLSRPAAPATREPRRRTRRRPLMST